MEILIKQIDPKLPLPRRHSAGAAGIDLYARIDVDIEPGAIERIPLNIVIQTPKDHVTLLLARSSAHKKGIMAANAVGVIDSDYCGPDDELMMLAHNFTKEPVTIERGDRIAQILIVKITDPILTETTTLNSPSRGGFGTTGF